MQEPTLYLLTVENTMEARLHQRIHIVLRHGINWREQG